VRHQRRGGASSQRGGAHGGHGGGHAVEADMEEERASVGVWQANGRVSI
jgi:hypothetical protein